MRLIQAVVKSNTISLWHWRSALLCLRRSVNFKGTNCISHVSLEWTNAQTIPASEELIAFVALSSSCSQSVVTGRHLLYAWEKSACHADVQSNGADFTKKFQIPRNSGGTEHVQTVCTRLFFSLHKHKSLGTRLIVCMIMTLNVVSLYSTCYCVNMCIQLCSGGKLLFTASYYVYDHDLECGFSFLHLLLCQHVHSLMLSM